MLRNGTCLFLLLNFVSILSTFAQHQNEGKESEHQVDDHQQAHKKHVISASLNHTIIFSAVKNGESKAAIHVPSFGLNYTYEITPKWGIGLHNDIILEEFIIEQESSGEELPPGENENSEFLERETPISVAVVLIYKPLPYLGLMAGAGREFSPKENFNLIRFGVETPFHLAHDWEVFGLLTYDINIDAYNSLNYGIGIAKMF